MKKKSETPIQAAADSETVAPIEKSSIEKSPIYNPKARRRLGLFTLLAITVIAILGIASSVMVAKQALQNSQNNSTQQIETALATLTNQQNLLSDNLKNTSEFIQSKQANQQEQLNALIKNVKSDRTLEATQKEPWLLRKARYYLELAQINSQWSNNQEASILLLQEAHALLQKIPDERLYEVEQTIAKETAALKSTPPVDVAGLMEKLDKAQATMVQLPFKPLKPTPTSQATPSSWRGHWLASLNILEKLVIVRHHKPGDAPILTPLYQTILRERISMDLQEAQWALLQNNSKIYHESLARVIKGIKQGFVAKEADNTNSTNTSSEVSAFLAELHQLQQVQLMSTKTDITQSLTKLDEIINSNSSNNSNSNSNIIKIPKSNTSSPKQGSQLP